MIGTKVSFIFHPGPGFIIHKQYSLSFLFFLLWPLRTFSCSCYCGKWLFLFHSKCCSFTNSSLENYNLNYTRRLRKPKPFKIPQPTGSFSLACPCTSGQWSWAEQNTVFFGRVRGPRRITPCKIWLGWVSRAVLKAKRSQSRSDSSQRDLGWGGGGPDSPALPQGGIKKPSFQRTSGYLRQSRWLSADESHGLHPENPESPNTVPHIAAPRESDKFSKKTQWLPGGIEGLLRARGWGEDGGVNLPFRYLSHVTQNYGF